MISGEIKLVDVETTFTERAPTLALPRKREMERIAFGANAIAHEISVSSTCKDTGDPAIRHVAPPLPLAGEGWGGGLAAAEVLMAEQKSLTWKVSSTLRSSARTLRKNSSDAERILWSALRDHRLNGAGFRRQVPIEKYIADFVCHAARLVIELDGGQHFSDEAEQLDAQRSAMIEVGGFQVLRFSNYDVMTNRSGVLEMVAAAVAARAPALTLPRRRGRGQRKLQP